MFIGFNVESLPDLKSYREFGKSIYEGKKKDIEYQIKEYLNINGSLNGEKINKDWFPKVEANIFLSHSHNNMDDVFELTGWLSDVFELEVFVDSFVWNYSNDLIKLIDDEYCRHTNGTSYDYDKRNHSTSHVHMMLSIALTKMIDKTECLFFLKTPESINTSDTIKNSTFSPWIYHELAMSDLIRKKTIGEHRKTLFPIQEQYTLEKSARNLKVDHDVTTHLDKLIALSQTDLSTWKSSLSTLIESSVSVFPLDLLYSLKEVDKYKNNQTG